MERLDLTSRFMLSQSKLYHDFMKVRFEMEFYKLKRDKKAPIQDRHRRATDLLQQLDANFQNVWPTVENQLAMCVDVTNMSSDLEKWMFLLDNQDPLCTWYREWFPTDERFEAILPWFDGLHNWNGMSVVSYLEGARVLVRCPKLFPKIFQVVARTVMEDWALWYCCVTDEDGLSFLESMHADICVVKLGLDPGDQSIQQVVPSSWSVDTARRMLKFVGTATRKTFPPTSAIGALHARVNAGHAGGTRVRGDKRHTPPSEDEDADDNGAPSAASAPRFNIGDEVITRSRTEKDCWDGQRATVVKFKAKKVTVTMLSGNCTGQKKDFTYGNLSPCPATAGSKRPAVLPPDNEPANKTAGPVLDGALQDIFGPVADLPK